MRNATLELDDCAAALERLAKREEQRQERVKLRRRIIKTRRARRGEATPHPRPTATQPAAASPWLPPPWSEPPEETPPFPVPMFDDMAGWPAVPEEPPFCLLNVYEQPTDAEAWESSGAGVEGGPC